MKANIKPCIEQHLVEKAKGGNTVPADDWFDTADAHLTSVAAIINSDPNGAIILTWDAMHKTGKGLAATGGYRLQEETHGKVVDFLICVFSALTDQEKGIIRSIQMGRNAAAYDNPTLVSKGLAGAAFNLARQLLSDARTYVG